MDKQYDKRTRKIEDPKVSKQRNCSEQLQTHNLTTDDVEKINDTIMGE